MTKNTIREKTVNGKSVTIYDSQECETSIFTTVKSLMKCEYKDQGELYEKLYGVSREDSVVAGWCPYATIFEASNNGWRQFLIDEGVVEVVCTETEKTDTLIIEEYLAELTLSYAMVEELEEL